MACRLFFWGSQGLSERQKHRRLAPRSKFNAAALRRFYSVGFVILWLCLLVGGGGTPAELAELAVQLGCLGILLYMALRGSGPSMSPVAIFSRDNFIGTLIAALLLIFCAQLVPLPPSIWTALPGREAIVQNVEALGKPLPWLPLSIVPGRTLSSLLALIPPLVAYGWASGSGRSERNQVFVWLGAFLILSCLLQALQTSGHFLPYSRTQLAATPGFHANRNAQADLIAIGMVVLALRPRPERVSYFYLQQWAGMILLLTAMILTGSRAGFAMAMVSLAILTVRGIRDSSFRLSDRKPLLAGAAAFVVGAVAIVYAIDNTMVRRTIDRFGGEADGRFEVIWPDAIYAMGQFFPFGSGIGTFIPAFQLYESRETLVRAIINRAHNDYFEIIIEAGLVGGLLIAALLLAIVTRCGTVIRNSEDVGARWRAWAFLISSVLIALHSIVDYPLRAMSIASLLAMMLGLVVADARTLRMSGRISEEENVA